MDLKIVRAVWKEQWGKWRHHGTSLEPRQLDGGAHVLHHSLWDGRKDHRVLACSSSALPCWKLETPCLACFPKVLCITFQGEKTFFESKQDDLALRMRCLYLPNAGVTDYEYKPMPGLYKCRRLNSRLHACWISTLQTDSHARPIFNSFVF